MLAYLFQKALNSAFGQIESDFVPFVLFYIIFCSVQQCPVTKSIKTSYNAFAFNFLYLFQSMTCQFDEFYPCLNQGFVNLIQHRFLSLFRAHHWKFLCLLMVLGLFSNKVFDCTALFLHKKLQWL